MIESLENSDDRADQITGGNDNYLMLYLFLTFKHIQQINLIFYY